MVNISQKKRRERGGVEKKETLRMKLTGSFPLWDSSSQWLTLYLCVHTNVHIHDNVFFSPE